MMVVGEQKWSEQNALYTIRGKLGHCIVILLKYNKLSKMIFQIGIKDFDFGMEELWLTNL